MTGGDVWLSAVITAPRPGGSLLESTLQSVRRAGFDPIVVEDVGRRGAWQTWLTAARALVYLAAEHQQASVDPWLLICEDDIELAADARVYLTDHRPPDDGVCSLYAAAPNDSTIEAPSGVSVRAFSVRWDRVRVPQRAFGALALAMRLGVMRRIVDNPPRPNEPHGTDHNIGLFCRASGVPWYVHAPSLAVHRGEVSSLPEAGVAECRQCRAWARKYLGSSRARPGVASFVVEGVDPAAKRMASVAGPTADRGSG